MTPVTNRTRAPEGPASDSDGAPVGDSDEPPLFRHPELNRGDGSTMWQLATASEALEANSEYSYHLLTHFFSETCLIAEQNGQQAGFIAGLRPPDRPDALFVWQIGVAPDFRGQGLARAMLSELAARCYDDGVRFIEATIAPSNEASQRTFHSYARKRRTVCEERPLFASELFEDDGHEDEIRYRIGPIDRRSVPEYTPERWEQQDPQHKALRMIA